MDRFIQHTFLQLLIICSSATLTLAQFTNAGTGSIERCYVSYPTVEMTYISPKSGSEVTGIVKVGFRSNLKYNTSVSYWCQPKVVSRETTYSISGGPLAQTISGSSSSLDTSSLEPGKYTITVVTKYSVYLPDYSGRASYFSPSDYDTRRLYTATGRRSTTVNVIRDVQPPELKIIYPIQGLTIRGQSKIRVSASDASGVRDLHFLAGNRDLGIYGADTTEIDFDTRLFPDGNLLLRVRAVDAQNNPIVTSITVDIDNVDDAPEISFIDLFDNQGVSGPINVRTDSFDDRGIEYVKFYIDGVEVATDLIAPYDAYIYTEDYKNGPHQIAAIAVDTKGETSSASIQLLFQNGDITPPIARITSLIDKARVSGEIAVKTKVEDASGIEKVEFYLGTKLLKTATLPPYDLSFDTTQAANGIYNLGIVAYDRANNIQTDSVVLIIENGDQLNASVFITKPAANSVLSGFVELEALAIDNVAIKEVRFLLDDKILGATKLYPYRFIFDTAGYPDGAYTLFAQAIDYEGNVGTESISIDINNTNPDFIYNETDNISGNPGEMIKGYALQVMEQIDLLGLQKVALTRSAKKEHKRAFKDTMKTLLKQIRAGKNQLSKRQAKKLRRLAAKTKARLNKVIRKSVNDKALNRSRSSLKRIVDSL